MRRVPPVSGLDEKRRFHRGTPSGSRHSTLDPRLSRMPSEDQIREALKSVRYPGFSRDIVSFGIVRGAQVDATTKACTVQLVIATNDPNVLAKIKADATAALE